MPRNVACGKQLVNFVAYLRGCLVTTPEFFLSPPRTASGRPSCYIGDWSTSGTSSQRAHVDIIVQTTRAWHLPSGQFASRWWTCGGATAGLPRAGSTAAQAIRTVLHPGERGRCHSAVLQTSIMSWHELRSSQATGGEREHSGDVQPLSQQRSSGGRVH